MSKIKKPKPDKQEAAGRLAQMMRALAAPPEPILELLERLEIPCHIRQLDDGDFFVIRSEDLLAGEERNQKQGSQLQRMYGIDV
jgi:hypothetical protein